MIKILLIEDDLDLGKYLSNLLMDEGYSVKLITDGSAAIKQLEAKQPDLLILDLGLPKIGGETVCTEARKLYADLPIIILTARDGVSDVVHGLGLGANDYVSKPFESSELLARISAVLRAYHSSDPTIKIADLELNSKTISVTRAGQEIPLTAQEFKLLNFLMNNPGRVLSRDMILSKIWDNWEDIETRVVDVYIGYLRKKIDNPYSHKLIHSVRGFGYCLKD